MSRIAEFPLTIEIHRAIWDFVKKNLQNKLKELDIIQAVSKNHYIETDVVRHHLCVMIDEGVLTYTHNAMGSAFVEIPEIAHLTRPTPDSKNYVIQR